MEMETNIQNNSKKNPKINPVIKRLEALKKLLELEKSTSKAILYKEWEIQPNIVYVD